jgi:two-component system, chemotaxis family, chemotaxis protein CheY
MQNSSEQAAIRAASAMIADPSQFGRRLTRNMLVNLGMRSITEIGDGLAALDAISSGKPDVLIMEWDLPRMSGTELLRRIRSPGSFRFPDLPILVLTTRTERRYVMHAMAYGAHEFIAKPTSTSALRDRLVSVLCYPRAMVKLGQFYVPKPRVWPSSAVQGVRTEVSSV